MKGFESIQIGDLVQARVTLGDPKDAITIVTTVRNTDLHFGMIQVDWAAGRSAELDCRWWIYLREEDTLRVHGFATGYLTKVLVKIEKEKRAAK